MLLQQLIILVTVLATQRAVSMPSGIRLKKRSSCNGVEIISAPETLCSQIWPEYHSELDRKRLYCCDVGTALDSYANMSNDTGTIMPEYRNCRGIVNQGQPTIQIANNNKCPYLDSDKPEWRTQWGCCTTLCGGGFRCWRTPLSEFPNSKIND